MTPAELFRQRMLSSMQITKPTGIGATPAEAWQSRFSPLQPISSGIPGGGSVLGASTGGGSTAPAVQQGYQTPQGAPMQEARPQENIDYNAMYAPAFAALGQYEQTLQPQYETTVKEIEAEAAKRKGTAQTAQEEQLGTIASQKGREETRTKGAIAEARRLASEMMQGIQAKYGGTTSAGPAMSEILGAQATRNIATNQASYQMALADLDRQQNQTNQEFLRLSTQIEDDTSLQKERAKNQLQQALANIAGKRGELESEKAGRRIDAVKEYQSYLRDLDAQNVSFKQQLFTDYQNTVNAIEQYRQTQKAQVSTNLAAFEPQMFNVGGKSYGAVPSSGYRYLPAGEEEEETPFG